MDYTTEATLGPGADLYGAVANVRVYNATEALVLAEGLGRRTFLAKTVLSASQNAVHSGEWPVSIELSAERLQDVAQKLGEKGLLPAELDRQLVNDDLVE